MSTLNFAEVHNMIAFLSKPTDSAGFEQIIDFLNAHPIKYALTVNPTIYTSSVEQFLGRDLRFGDEEGIDFLPNETIFEQLLLMGFVQVFLNNQLDEMANHTRIYVPPSHTKKIFENMKRVGKGFFGRDTPLFPTMMVQAQEELGEDIAIPTETHPTPTITQPSTSKPQKKQKPRKPKRHDTEEIQPSGPTTNVEDEAFNEENISQHSNDPLHIGEDRIQLKKLMELCTNLQQRVFDLKTIKTSQAQEITSLKKRLKDWRRKEGQELRRLQSSISFSFVLQLSATLVSCSCELYHELGFDYLRDNLAGSSGQLVMRWFHGLPEFDGKKRSCRKRLANHNARRLLAFRKKSLMTCDVKLKKVAKAVKGAHVVKGTDDIDMSNDEN
nr:SBP-like protein [Tanacetum cinerariifolium]